MALGQFGEQFRFFAGYADGILEIAREPFPPLRGARTHGSPKMMPFRIAADEGFGKDDKIDRRLARFGQQRLEFLKRGRRIKQDATRLDSADFFSSGWIHDTPKASSIHHCRGSGSDCHHRSLTP